ncbi:hypothetical protein DXA90_04945 [Clostridiaceae bacterium OF09-1]|nr:hypothetical protein DXA90_04945 [Clostridiaceae bacterium OF09-1]
MIEPRFLQMCLMRLKNNRGLNIYLVEGGVEGRLTHDNVDAAYRLLEDQGLSETYAQQLKLKVLTMRSVIGDWSLEKNWTSGWSLSIRKSSPEKIRLPIWRS